MNKYVSRFCDIVLKPLFNHFLVKEMHGRENIPATNYILICNHASHMDLPIVGSLCTPRLFKFIGQTDRYKGWRNFLRAIVYWISGTIPLDRNSKQSGEWVLGVAKQALQNGDIIIMFPEGTRSRSGKMGTNKIGAAVLLTETGVPFLPVALSGTFELSPPGENFKVKKVAKVQIGKPMYFVDEIKNLRNVNHGTPEYRQALQDIIDKAMMEVRKMKAEMDGVKPEEI